MIEILVALTIVSIAALGIALNSIGAMQIAKRTELNYLASNLALSKVEDLAATDPSDLDSTDNQNETGVTITGTAITFTRATTITVNADESRTVKVVVTSEGLEIPTNATFETRFSLWE